MNMLNLAEVRARREKLNISQGEAARRAGFETLQQWNNIESGRRPNITLGTLYAIAEALGCEAGELLLPRKKRK